MAHPFRVFLSYAHEDFELAGKAAEVLAGLGLSPIWDRNIRPGSPFTDAIKGLIARSHVFMPLITAHAAQRPWVHQETGYAMALNIPILPVAVGTVPGEMAAQLQAIVVKADLSNLAACLEAADLKTVVCAPPANPLNMIEVTTWTDERTKLLAGYAQAVTELKASGRVRQRAALSSFSIPDKGLENILWTLREGATPRTSFQRHWQREERRALERHVAQAGCDLIIDPTFSLVRHGEEATKARLWIVYKFLESLPDDKVRVVLSPRAREGNLTIVGDWFSAESMSAHPTEGHRRTVFTWHAPTVLQTLWGFDEDFAEQCAETGSDASRSAAMSRLEEILGGWKPH